VAFRFRLDTRRRGTACAGFMSMKSDSAPTLSQSREIR
jgi:hypothetical protein